MIKQTTLHNILTWVIAVVLFIFQSLNYLIAWIKKYVKHGQKTTTVVTAGTTISSESNLNNKNVPENVITVQGLIQKHFDIPLIIAEDEPKVYSFIKSAKLLTSNEICKEKSKIDQFMENLVDDSYVARGLGLITATVGRQSEFYLYSKYDNIFENVVIRLNGRNGEIGQITISSKNTENIVEPKSIPMDYFYDKDRIKVTYTPFAEGVYTLTLVRNSLSICRSPYYISVEKSPTNSRSQIRLGTKKYKPVTKFAKSKHSSLETCDNSISTIEPSKPTICKNILPESEKNSIRTDVMSIVTKFESNSIHFKKRVHKSTSSTFEKGSETDSIDEISKYSNIPSKIETDNIHDTYVSALNSPSIHSKTKSTDNNFWNDVDITYKNSKVSDINTIDFESGGIKKPEAKPMTKLNECIGITKDIPEVKNVYRLQPTNSVLVESLKIGNSHDVEKHNQTFELMDENKPTEQFLDPTTRIDESEIKCMDNEPCIQNEVSCFDDEDRKTVVVMDSNEIESNPNDTVIQQITDSAQYNINTPFASVITKITNSICEKCSIQVSKIISEFPRDINITHKNNSNEMRSSFETLLAQPISININIDNMFEHPINDTNEHNSEHLLTTSPTKIKRIGIIDKDIKCNYRNEIEPIDNNSDELCDDINNMSKELLIKKYTHNSKTDKKIKDEIFDHCIVPFTENTIDKHSTVCQNNELSTNEIMKIKYSTTNEENVLYSNQFNNNTIHESDSKIEIQRQHLQKSSEHSMDLIKTNQFHDNINKEFNHNISKESDKPLNTSDLVTIDYDINTKCELVTDEFKINNVIIPDENTNIQSSVINNTVLASKKVTIATSEYKLEDNEEQKNNISCKNVTLTSIQNENQKLIIEKSIEPVLTSFKNKMVEKITQLYLNRDLSNIDNTSTFESPDKHLTNSLHEIQIDNNANSTEINTKCIETLRSQLKKHIDKNEISEIILNQQKTDNNHLFKYVENIIKTKINPSGLYAQTLGEIKLQTLVNTAMNHPNDQQIGNELKKMIIDNETQDDKINKINNDAIVKDIEATQCKIPLINDFDTKEVKKTNADCKQEIQTINVNENDTIVKTNAMKIKALQNFQKSHNTEIITPIIELRPTLETHIMNTSELVTVEENSSKEIQTTIEIIDSINIPKETDAVENIDDKNEYESVKLQFKDDVIIKIPHLVEKGTLNEVVENISTNTSTKSNSIENISMQTEIESPGLKKGYSANDETIERYIIYKLSPQNIDENIVIDKPNPQSIHTLNAQFSKNAAKLTIGINTSDPQFPNTAITVLIPSKIPIIENNSFIPKLSILSTLNKLDAIEILTIPTYSAECDKKKTKKELQNTSEPTLSQNKLFIMKNGKLEKIENIDETRTPTDTEIESLEYLNKSGKIKSIPPISNDTLAETTSLAGEVVEKPIKKHTEIESTPPIGSQSEPDKKVDEMLICAGAETPTVIDTSRNSLIRKIVVEFVTNKNKTPIEALEIIVHEQIEEEHETVTTPTTNSLIAVMDERVNIKNEGSDSYYVKSDDNVTNTETKTKKSIGKNNGEKIIENEFSIPINTLTVVVMENPKVNIVTVTTTTACTNSSTETVDVKTDVKKIIEEESPSLNNCPGELVQENMNMNTNTENETLLPIESIEEPKVEDITEPEITSCTESSTEMFDNQYHAVKIVDEVLINSLGEVMVENTEMNIVSESETFLPIGSTKESILVPKVEEDTSVTIITSCTDISTLTKDTQTNREKIIGNKSTAPNNSSGEVVVLNVNTEKETLLQIDKITGSVEKNKKIYELIQTLLPMKLSMEFIKEPKLGETETETEITSCTESSTKIIQYQDHAEKMFDQEASPVPIICSEEKVDGKSKVIIDTETETHLPILSTIESIEKPKVDEGIIPTKLPYCTESSTEIIDMQMGPDNVIVEPFPTPINFLSEILLEKTKVNINTESEALLPTTNYVEEREVVKEISEIALPIESAMGFMQEPKLEEDIIEIKIKSCTDSTTFVSQKDIEKVIEEKSSTPINSLGEVVKKNMNVNIDTENEILLPIDSITGSMEEKKEKYGLIDPTLQATMESIKEPKEDEDISITEKTSCTNSSSVILETKMEVEKVIEEVPPVLINSSGKINREKTKVNMDTEYETILLIESTIESIAEPEIDEDITQTIILLCTDSSAATKDVQTDVERVIEEVSMAPINCSDAEVDGKSKVNIHTKNEKILQNESTMESIAIPKTETETEFLSCTDSCNLTVDAQIDVQKGLDRVTPKPINSSGEVVVEKTNMNIDTGNETILPISTGSVEDRKAMEGTTEIELPVESTMESKKEPKVIDDRTSTEIVSCTDSSSVIEETRIDVEKVFEVVPPLPINSSGKIIGEKTKVIETILPIEATIESIEKPKVVKVITETKITSCTESSTADIMDYQTNMEKSPALISFSNKEVSDESKVNIDTEDELVLQIVSTKESTEKTKMGPNVGTETDILSCKESSTLIINDQNHTEKIVDEVPINCSGEEMGENINVSIVTENEKLLPIGSTMELVEEPICDSSSVILDTKLCIEKLIEEVPPVLIDPSDKVVGGNPKVNMDTEYETILPIESTIESITETELYEDITETEILSCTDSSTGNLVVQTNLEKVIKEVSPTLINSSYKVMGEEINVNIDNENETLLPVDTSTGFVKDKKEKYNMIDTLLPIESTVKSIEEPKVEDITEPEITSCIESSTEMIDSQNHVEKIVDQTLLVLINSSDEVVGENTNVIIDTKNEAHLAIESTKESIELSKEVEGTNETKKNPCTYSFTVAVDVHTDVEKVINEEYPSPINSFGQLVQENINMNIYTENEKLLPIESIEEEKIVDQKLPVLINSSDEVVGENTNVIIGTKNEAHLAIESTKESIELSKEVECKNETKKIPCTNSFTVADVHTDVEKVINEESQSPSPINSFGELVEENINMNINTDNVILLPIKSIEEPKVEGMTEPEITSCTESSTEIIDSQNHAENIVDQKLPVLINSSDEVVGENTNVIIDTENETLLPIESSMVSRDVEDTNKTKKIPCANSFTVAVDVHTDVEKVINEESQSPSPINSFGELVEENINMNINTDNVILLPIKSIEEPKVEVITEPEITSCTESSTKMIDSQNHAEKIVDQKLSVLINSPEKVVGENTNVIIDTENEKLLPIESTMESIEVSKEVEDTNETKKIPCTNSFTLAVDVHTDVEKVIDEEYPSPINSFGQLVQENINMNIYTENEKLLPIESIQEEKIVDQKLPVLINSSDEVVGENTNVIIDTKNEAHLAIESTKESIELSKEVECTNETKKIPCTNSFTVAVDVHTDVEKDINEESQSPSPINSFGELVEENINMNINTDNVILLPIKSIEEPKVEGMTEPEITSCTESSTEMIDGQNHTEKIVDQKLPVLINSSDEVVGENTNVIINTENETLLPIESTIESIEVSKEVEDTNETKKIPCTNSFTVAVDVHTDVEKVIDEESLSPINSFGELVQEIINMNINTENETLLPIELTTDSIVEPNVVDYYTEPEITSCTEPLTKIINPQYHAEKIVDNVLINSLSEVMGKKKNMKIVTESETLLSSVSTGESKVEPKLEQDISVTTVTSCTDISTLTKDTQTYKEKIIEKNSNKNTNTSYIDFSIVTIDVQRDVEKVIEEESLLMKSLGEAVQENSNVNIYTKNETFLQIDTSTSSVEEMKEIDEVIETFLPINLNMESIKVSKKLEDINETENMSFTDSYILTKDAQTDVNQEIEKKTLTQINFLVEILGKNTKVNNVIEKETLLPIESTKELTVEPEVEADITETAITPCTDSSTVTIDVQTEVEKVFEEEYPAPIISSDKVVEESTNLNIDTENETLLQMNTYTMAVKPVIGKKTIENEYSTPTVSSLLGVEKQNYLIIDSKTETLLPIGTNTTSIDEPYVVGHVSENEHAALIDSSITSIKQQIKIDTETEIETLLLIDNLTESVKEQIVEKITKNKTPALIDSLAEMVEEGSKVNIDTDNQTLLRINTPSTIIDDQIVKNSIENEIQTPIYCVVGLAEEQTKINIETNDKTITPIDIFTTSVEEELNVEYLCENENTTHIDLVTTMIKNQTEIDIETENETLLSIENTSVEEQMDEVDKIIQNNLFVDFSAATELKGYEIVTGKETEPSTSIDTFNTTMDRQTVKENFKEIESTIQIATSTEFEEEQKSVERITVIENVLSIGTFTASVEEEIQVEEVIKNESATSISYSTIHDVTSLEEPKVIKNETKAMRSSVTVVEDQTEVAAAEVVIDTFKESLDKTIIEKSAHNKTSTPMDILVTAAEKQTNLEHVTENEIPILVNTSTEYVEKQIKIEKVTENETITLIACEVLPKVETNEFEAESENKTLTTANNSASITIKRTEVENVTERTLQNDDIIYGNTKTNLIGGENKTENSDNPNNYYLKFGETSKMHRFENEDDLQRKSYDIQKLEMSVECMKTTDDDYYEKTFVQLKQCENISKMEKVNVDGENKTTIDDKLYTVNESDLNAILCASSLEEALTLLDSKIKFKFKHKKSSSKINSVEYIPKIQTSESNSSGVNTNFTDARKFFKEIEKKSKK